MTRPKPKLYQSYLYTALEWLNSINVRGSIYTFKLLFQRDPQSDIQLTPVAFNFFSVHCPYGIFYLLVK